MEIQRKIHKFRCYEQTNKSHSAYDNYHSSKLANITKLVLLANHTIQNECPDMYAYGWVHKISHANNETLNFDIIIQYKHATMILESFKLYAHS